MISFLTQIVCDNCAKTVTQTQHDELTVRIEMHDRRWTIGRKNGVWQDYCPNCAEHGLSLVEAAKVLNIT